MATRSLEDRAPCAQLGPCPLLFRPRMTSVAGPSPSLHGCRPYSDRTRNRYMSGCNRPIQEASIPPVIFPPLLSAALKGTSTFSFSRESPKSPGRLVLRPTGGGKGLSPGGYTDCSTRAPAIEKMGTYRQSPPRPRKRLDTAAPWTGAPCSHIALHQTPLCPPSPPIPQI